MHRAAILKGFVQVTSLSPGQRDRQYCDVADYTKSTMEAYTVMSQIHGTTDGTNEGDGSVCGLKEEGKICC